MSAPVEAANYTAERRAVDGVEVVKLADAQRKTEVWIAPSLGNNSYEMKVAGKRVFWSPYQTVGELKAKPAMAGNPFLAPWANRLDQEAYYANGKKYLLNPELNNYRRDGNRQPIHGLLVWASDWAVTALEADANGARVTSRLEFWRRPDWMAQFPFAHTIDMTYRLREGVLEVETVIENLSKEAMPVSVGFHPYFQVNDAPRDDWKVRLAARDQVVLGDKLTPTGELKPAAFASPLSLRGAQLDDVFAGLERDSAGRASFWVEGAKERVTVSMGPNYRAAVVYAPAGRNFICFEPMSGVTNAFNLAHAGKYRELQSIPPGGKWRESYWVQASGY